jgi:hypothetical protein
MQMNIIETLHEGFIAKVQYNTSTMSQDDAEVEACRLFGGIPTWNSKEGLIELQADSWGDINDDSGENPFRFTPFNVTVK